MRHGFGFGRAQVLQGLSSHPKAALESLEEIGPIIVETQIELLRTLIEGAGPTGKAQTLLDCIGAIGPGEPWLVFVERLATGEALIQNLQSAGHTCAFYRGALNSADREKLVTAFRSGDIQVLVSTSAGSEGLNLQHCRNLVNFDLHWNPLRMEQRIGRVHRLGQTQTVRIFNLVTRGSVDEIVLERLYVKLDLFQVAVGEFSTVLSTFEDSFNVEEEIRNALEGATDLETFGSKCGPSLSEDIWSYRRREAIGVGPALLNADQFQRGQVKLCNQPSRSSRTRWPGSGKTKNIPTTGDSFRHRYLMKRFALVDSEAEDACSIGGPNDKGLDAIWFDDEQKTVFALQAKFSSKANAGFGFEDATKLRASLEFMTDPTRLPSVTSETLRERLPEVHERIKSRYTDPVLRRRSREYQS